MTEFRVLPSDALTERRRHRSIRIILWGAVFALVAIPVIGIGRVRSASYQENAVYTCLAVAILIGAVGGAYYAAARMGLERAKLKTTLVLTDQELVRRREGWPDVRIALSEINALYAHPNSLVVESVDRSRRIAVWKDVERFESLRAELLKHGPLLKPPAPSLLGWIPTVVSFLCWPLVLWSNDALVVKSTGIVLLVLLGWSCFSFGKKLRDIPKRVVLQLWLAASWAAAAWLVYSRFAKF